MKTPMDYSTLFILLLEKLYDISVTGLGCIDSASQLAASYRRYDGTGQAQIEALIQTESAKSAVSGFVSGIGSLITLPISLPANMTATLFIQTRLVLTIALLCHRDIKDPSVQLLVKLALCGKSGKRLLLKHSATLLSTVSVNMVDKLQRQLLSNLIKEQGVKQSVKVGRYLPLIGGAIGAVVDGTSTYAIGRQAMTLFST